MNKLLSLGLLLVCAAGLSAQTPKEWTLLVYMAADNDLEPEALEDLAEMMTFGTSDTVNVVVQIDRSADYTDEAVGGLKDWTTVKRLLVQKGKLTQLADLGELDSTSVPAVKDFVAWGTKNYPAQKIALLFWDHGGGQTGYGSDEESNSALSIPDLRDGVVGGLKAWGKRLDLVGFDCCLMGALETARALAPSARYLLASEEVEPGFGWDWSAFALMAQKPGTDVRTLASNVITKFATACVANEDGAQFTLSLTDLDRIAGIEAALKTAEGSVLPQLKTLGGDFGRTRARSLEFGKSGDPSQDSQMVDLGDLARQWQTVPALQASGKALAAALQAAVVEQKVGSVQKAATGLSVWFPAKKAQYDPDYANYGSPSWVKLLEAYYRAGASIPAGQRATDQPESQEQNVSFDGATVTFIRDLEPAIVKNISDAALYYGVTTKGKTQILGVRDAVVDPEAGTATGEWDLSTLLLVQGKNSVPGLLSEDQFDDSTWSFSVPFSYYPGKDTKNREEVWLSVSIDRAKNEIVEETFYQESDNLVGEFQPAKGSRIVARLFEKNKDGDWDLVDRGASLDPTKPIDYDFQTANPKGDFYLSLDITDFGGEENSEEFEGKLP